jgi:cation diffusion facilitator CzcD-associated flavoprotein CzcO
VVVVGTGASAIQFVPAIVDRVSSLTVFQRSAPYVVPKPDTEYRPLHHQLFDRFPAVMQGERGATFHLSELLNRALGGDSAMSAPFLATLRQVWKAHLRRQVKDAALRAKLVPDYPIGCKRILFSNDWYPALARDHVDVVTDAVVGVDATGVVTGDGTHHDADVLIWGTGFAATDFLRTIRVTGRDGLELHDVWRDGATAYLGIGVPGFPNLFCVYGPNTNLGGSSIIGMMEAQASWIAQVVRRIADTDRRSFEVRREVADAYDREMQERLRDSVWAGCDSWYQDGGRITTNWPGLVGEYLDRLAQVDWSALVGS